MGYPDFVSGDVLNASDMNAVGLWRLGGGTFSAVNGFNVDSVFSANYDFYVLNCEHLDTNTAGETRIQFRTSGSTNTNNNYVHQNNYFTTATTSVRNTVGTTSSLVTQNVGASGWNWSMVISNPFSNSKNTVFFVQGNVNSGTLYFSGGGAFDTTTRFDGVRISRSAGNFSGIYAIYGYKA
jgi:hypothetical protein